MAYVIYNKETTLFLSARRGYRYVDSYKSESAAKAALTRLEKKGELGCSYEEEPIVHPNGLEGVKRTEVPYVREDFAIAEKSYFHENIEKKEIRTGIVGSAGKDFEVGVNTPWTSGPWSETYWCS